MEKKKILIINNQCLQRGGAQAVIMSIVRNLSEQYTFDILTFTNSAGFYDNEFKSYGGKIICLPNYEGNNNFRRRLDLYVRWIPNRYRLDRILKANGPYSAIHTIVAYEGGYICRVAYKNGIPVRIVHTLTITDISKNKIAMRVYSYFALKRIKKYATDLIGCTEKACTSMFRDTESWKLVYNPYDAKKFTYSSENKSDVKFEAPVLIQIASYSSNKNQLFTIAVFNAVVKKQPKSKLYFVGYELESGYLNKMKEEIDHLGLSDKVFFFQSDADIPQLLLNSTHLLLPSILEGFGIVLIEAQSMGVRCIVSGTVPRLPDCGGCTFLPIDDGAEVWADRIIEEFHKYRGEHIAFDCQKFSEEAVVDRYREIYQ